MPYVQIYDWITVVTTAKFCLTAQCSTNFDKIWIFFFNEFKKKKICFNAIRIWILHKIKNLLIWKELAILVYNLCSSWEILRLNVLKEDSISVQGYSWLYLIYFLGDGCVREGWFGYTVSLNKLLLDLGICFGMEGDGGEGKVAGL